MPNDLARSLNDDNDGAAVALTATRAQRDTEVVCPGNWLRLLKSAEEPTQTVAELLLLNAALAARNAALLAALDRYDRLAGTRVARKNCAATASVSDADILHMVPTRRSQSTERNAGFPSASFLSSLTLRQTQILHLVLAGHPSKNIAADLKISQRTVENHRAAIMQRTGATSLPALARMAVGAGGSADCKAVS